MFGAPLNNWLDVHTLIVPLIVLFIAAVILLAFIVIRVIILQIHFRYERRSNGESTLLLEKRAAGDGFFKTLVNKLGAWRPRRS